jgi:hypothetical protein
VIGAAVSRVGRCPLCGEPVTSDDDAVHVHGGGLAHQSCLDEDEGRIECGVAELERMQRSQRRARERKAG